MSKLYWLMKTKPGCYSIDDLQKDKVTYWDGVRNCLGLEKMVLLQKGSRLSVQPVTEKEFKIIESLCG